MIRVLVFIFTNWNEMRYHWSNGREYKKSGKLPMIIRNYTKYVFHMNERVSVPVRNT